MSERDGMNLLQAIAIVEPHVAERLRIAKSRDRGANLVGGSSGDADREFADALLALITSARLLLETVPHIPIVTDSALLPRIVRTVGADAISEQEPRT